MSGYEFDEGDEFGIAEPVDDPDLTPEQELDASYWGDPAGTLAAVTRQAVADVAAEVEAANEQRLSILQSARTDEVIRDAHGAMDATYPGWTDEPGLADALKARKARGRLDFSDAQRLAEDVQSVYLEQRRRNTPSQAEQDAAYWDRVKANNRTEYGF